MGPLLARRAFLVRCIAGAGLGVGVLLYAPDPRERPPSAAAEPSTEPGAPRVSFFALGDTGWPTAARAEVVTAMAAKVPGARPDFVVLLGDNFYPKGVRSVDDPMWRTQFEDAFGTSELRIPFYAALGNHDHDGNTQAQVEYALRDGRWKMPGPYYAFTRPLSPRCEAEFFVLDTTPLHLGAHAADAQMRWLEDKLERSRAIWKIVVGHHPMVSGGTSGGSDKVRELLGPLFDRYGVDLFLSGHDHDLQLLESDTGCLQVVSGAGSMPREVGRREGTLFAEEGGGFAWILLSETELWIQFVSASLGPRFTHRVSRTA